MHRASTLLLSLLALTAPTLAQAGASLADPARGLALAADADGDGEVTAAEWGSFVAGLGADAEGVLDRARVKARLFVSDPDAAGAPTARDVEQVLAGGRRAGGALGLLVRSLADADESGDVDETERAELVAAARGAAGDGPLGTALLADWVRRVEAQPPPENPNAITAGVFLLGLDPVLDADGDGRVTTADLDALRAGLDGDGDGLLSAAELARPGGAGPATPPDESRWTVSEEERTRPPLMPWQRTLDDALALSHATGKPLLICVNIDGEAASEVLANGRYRDPAFVALVRGFVPVLASPDTHSPRARDDRGRRLPDPRFGRLLDAEHVDIEPALYERYFDGRRVAPRHVGVAPDGRILFDLYLLQDLSVIDAKLREHGVFTDPPPDPATLDDEALFASPDAANREELEHRFVLADEETRLHLAGLALSGVRATQHPELIHLALRDPSEKVRRQGVWTLVQNAERIPADVLPLAFDRAGGDAGLVGALVGAAGRAVAAAEEAGDTTRRDAFAFALRVFGDLERGAPRLDVERWRLELALWPPVTDPEPHEEDLDATGRLLDELDERLARSPDDVELLVLRAAGQMRLARIQLETGGNPSFFLEDVVRTSRRAIELAPENGRALAYCAWASYMLADLETAGELAERALVELEPQAGSPLAFRALDVLAIVRTRTLYEAIGAGQPWPEGLVAEAVAASELRAVHPLGTEAHWKAHLDLLGTLNAHARQASAVREGLARYPESADLHGVLRQEVLRDEGADALEEAYDERPLAAAFEQHGPALDWFWGLATFLAAERHVQDREPEQALDAYGRSFERFERSAGAEPAYAGSAAHYQCFALAGSARLLADLGRYEDAVDAVVEAHRLAPGSVGLDDGLGESPAGTERALRRTLARAGRDDLADELKLRLGELRAAAQG